MAGGHWFVGEWVFLTLDPFARRAQWIEWVEWEGTEDECRRGERRHDEYKDSME